MGTNKDAPFPYSIIEGAGMGYAVGLLGSSTYHFLKGPTGARLQYLTMKAPTTAGTFAVWGGLYDTISGGLAHIRHKEDPWNTIWAGGITSGLLALRSGLRPASAQFVIGAALLAGMEGMMILTERGMTHIKEASRMGPSSEPSPEWLRRGYGDRKSNDDKDTSPPDMPNFEFK
ncbi:hypothetical protein RND81_06G163700 [Saponaria officinalis]|uniref:Uncharacterized protein n=1 Tax=Saponaria officinalis TaxID=3572 RepID=A0AAW1KC29_SAPOF